MSKYSLDSLENMEADSLEEHISTDDDNDDECNLERIKFDQTAKFDENALRHLNPLPATAISMKGSYLNRIDSEGEENPRSIDTIATTDGIMRNASGSSNTIVVSGKRFTRRCRQKEDRATESWLCTKKSKDADVAVAEHHEEVGAVPHRGCTRDRTSSGPTTQQRSSGNVTRNSGCCTSEKMRTDKRLGNILASFPGSRTSIGPSSYSELYRRRLSNTLMQPSIRSPESSTLSICGDSQLEDLSLEEDHASLPATSRDDSSDEFSFYRRFVDTHGAISVRSCESRSSCGTDVAFSVEPQRERSISGKKRPAYRPYTIEEYRSLSVPRPDRSLGPDKDEVLTKREWLMRRRSYGDSVSARNCERILQRTRGLKSRRAIAQKCFLPPLKDQDAASKDRESSRISEMDDTTQECLSKRPVDSSAKRAAAAEAPRKAGKTTSPANSSPLISRGALEDRYLKTLQQRHSRERELADRLMRQALNS